MKILEQIQAYFKTEKINKKAPEGYCPNCWGRQEYGGAFYEAIKNNELSKMEPNGRKGWIQNYAEAHLGAIQLRKQEDGLVCQKCKIVYAKNE